MRRTIFILLLLILSSLNAMGSETNILYNQDDNTDSDFTQKNYYIKESVKIIDSKNKDVYQLVTHGVDTYKNKSNNYRSTLQINCKTMKFRNIKHWSLEYGDDKGDIANGEWYNIASYYGGAKLAEQICTH